MAALGVVYVLKSIERVLEMNHDKLVTIDERVLQAFIEQPFIEQVNQLIRGSMLFTNGSVAAARLDDEGNFLISG